MNRRARVLALFGASAVCAGLAVSLVNGYASEVRTQVGPLVPVVVARAHVPAGRVVTRSDVQLRLSLRRVPERFAPPDALRSPGQALGLRASVALAPGSYVGRSQLERPVSRDPGRALARARLIEVPVSGAASLRDVLRPGSRSDVLVTSGSEGGRPRTYVAVQSVEILGLRAAQDEQAGGEGVQPPDAVATLRVTLRQAVLLAAARNFAREVRLVPRQAGDRSRVGSIAIGAEDLHP